MSVAFDPFEPGFVDWPYDQYARLRATEPVHWSTLLEGWVLTRYDEVSRVLRDPTISVEIDNAKPTALVEHERNRMLERGRKSETLVLRDDPDHARLRKLMAKPFGARAVERLRDMIAARVEVAFAEVAGRGEMDVIADFAYPLPVGVFCEMLGIPDEDSPKFREWTNAVARNLDPVITEAERERNLALLDEMEGYLRVQIEEKRQRPTDDILTALVQAEEDGDKLTSDELVMQLVTLYVAGHEPTAALVGNGLLALLRRPEQLALVQERPDLLPNAVNELLRYDGPNQFVRRIVMVETDLGGTTVSPGDVLYCCVGAANHDPAKWGDDAEVVDVERPDAAQHLQFGMGIHSCLGAHLARLQAELAFAALFRLRDLRLAGEPRRSERMVLRGLQSLPVNWRS